MEASKADLDLAEIRERANNATPGPWEADRPQVWGPNDESVAFVTTHDPGEGSGQPEWEANTVFIAHARTDIPNLLDHVDTLTAQLAAKNRSIGVVNPAGYAKPSERPDDSEINEVIDEAESFEEALFDIADKYGANVTNNMERWQDGEYLRHVGEFIHDVKQAADRFLVPALLDRLDLLGKKLEVQKEISRQNFEEWKKVADEEESRADQYAARLAAVRELHPPITYDDEQYCNYCVEAFPWGGESAPYPCPTIQAIEGDQ